MIRLILRSTEGIANSLEAISIMRYLESRFGREAISSIRFPPVSSAYILSTSTTYLLRSIDIRQDLHTKRLMGYATVSLEPEIAEQLLATPGIVLPTRQNVQSSEPTLGELYRSRLRLKNITELETSTSPGRMLTLIAETMAHQGAYESTSPMGCTATKASPSIYRPSQPP